MPIKRARLKISDYNEKRKTKLKTQERRVKQVSLSLTSMVDMFAILVIFLLANSSNMQEWVQVGKGITLPQARSQDVPEKAATLQISQEQIFGDDKPLIDTKTAMKTLGPLQKYLSTLDKKNGYINIVGHETLSFGLIKRIVAACQDAGFNNVNLAVRPRVGAPAVEAVK